MPHASINVDSFAAGSVYVAESQRS